MKLNGHEQSPLCCRVATNERDHQRVMELRYQVYCEECGFLDPASYPERQERDVFDDHAIHLLVSNGADDVMGTMRLVLPSASGLPTQDYFTHLPAIDWHQVGELSRLIVAPRYRGHTKSVFLALAVKLYNESVCRGLTGWICTMFVPTWWLFRRLGFPFRVAGEISTWPMGSEHLVIPASVDFAEAAVYLKGDHPDLYQQFVPEDSQPLSDDEQNMLPRFRLELAQEEAHVRAVTAARRTRTSPLVTPAYR